MDKPSVANEVNKEVLNAGLAAIIVDRPMSGITRNPNMALVTS